MSIRPIIFSGPMVKALIDLRKTQTRRLATSPLRHCQPGDLLYVRETFAEIRLHSLPIFGPSEPRSFTTYKAGRRMIIPDGTPASNIDKWPVEWREDLEPEKWRPSIHMPRRLSRIALRVDDVRFQRLHDITEEDCIAEGVEPLGGDGPNLFTVELPNGWNFSQPTARPCYEMLWRELHGNESWESNPPVVAISFKPLAGNVDRLAA